MDKDKCRTHGLFFETTCSWCGDQICKNCIEACNGRKYCLTCYKKLNTGTVSRYFNKPWGEKPEKKIVNVDSSLSEDEIKRKRQALDIKEKARKILSEK
ncbi:MAG: hypothetical protein ABH828_00075 [archaeon]